VFECPNGHQYRRVGVEDAVVHLVAEKRWESSAEIKPSGAASRDFINGNFALRATVPHKNKGLMLLTNLSVVSGS
jgi:hypothetical protein